MPGGALAGGNGGVAVEETPDFGIVVAGIEVVEPDFAVEDVAATADETSGEMQKSAKGGRAPFCAARFWMDREMENARHSPRGRQGFHFWYFQYSMGETLCQVFLGI